MTDLREVYGSVFLGYNEHVTDELIHEVRSYGLRIHADDVWHDGEYVDTRWYVAHPKWVSNYHQSGGMWGYCD